MSNGGLPGLSTLVAAVVNSAAPLRRRSRPRRRLRAAALLLLLTLLVALPLQVYRAPRDIVHAQGIRAATLTFVASEDTFVAKKSPSVNQGNLAYLHLHNRPSTERRGLVRFSVTGVPAGAQIVSATLSLFVSAGTRANSSLDSAGYVARVNGSWSEAATVWTNAPAVGATIANLTPRGSAIAGTWKNADVVSVISGNGTYDFYVLSDSPTYDDLYYASSESTPATSGLLDAQPRLDITWQTASGTGVAHGPIAGAVTGDSATIMVRASAAANVWAHYDTLPQYDRGRAIIAGPATAAAADDFVAKMSLAGLQPETTYYYWLAFDDGQPDTSTTYQFKTFPAPGALRDFSFAVFADLASRDSYDAPAYARAASFNPAFVGQIGDFRHQNPAVAPTPIQISNWWLQNQQAIGGTLMGEDFSNFIGDRFPFFHIWDDHDFGKDDSDMTLPYKAMATQAFKQYFPTYPLSPDGQGLWQKFEYGQEASVFVLDLRSQRSPDNQPDGPNKSMLGAAQKQWLKDSLLASQQAGVIWKFIISSSVWNRLGKYTDSWSVFATEQNELIQFIKDNQIKNVIVITGDFHTGGAIDGGVGTISCGIGWCIPEFNVPTTNIFGQVYCTQVPAGPDCGTWSVGMVYGQTGGVSNAGFGLFDVTPSTVTMRAIRGSDGFANLTYTVTAMP